MPQLVVWNNIYQFSRCAFSAAFNQQIPVSAENRSLPNPQHRWEAEFSSFSLPAASLGLAPMPDTAAQRVPVAARAVCQACERAGRKDQHLCPQFFTFFLLQAQHLKLCLRCSVLVPLNSSQQQNTGERGDAILPQESRTSLFFSQY